MRSAEASRYCRVSAAPVDLPASAVPTPFTVDIRHHGDRSLLRHPIAIRVGCGILTACPSASPVGYTLGPD